jgi:hypothetical protein
MRMSHRVIAAQWGRYASAAIVLVAGSLLYLVRPRDAIVVSGIATVGFPAVAQLIHDVREAVYANVRLPGWFCGGASDAAFGFSLGAIVARAPRAIVASGALIAVSHELGQALGLVPGTFDPIDLVLLAQSFALAVALHRHPDSRSRRNGTSLSLGLQPRPHRVRPSGARQQHHTERGQSI